jgi:hypothetical protein
MNADQQLINYWRELNKDKVISKKQKDFSIFKEEDVSRMTKLYDGVGYSGLKEQFKFRNHKIAKIEWLDERMDTGCLTIDGDEEYHDYHTFALAAGIYTGNSMLEDFWMPRRSNGSTTQIETLPGGASLGEISDVLYFQERLLMSLNVPVSRLKPDQNFSIGRSQEISREEIKFSRFVERLQNRFKYILINPFITLLRLKGIDEKYINEDYFNVKFTQSNLFKEFKEFELLESRLGILGQITQFIYDKNTNPQGLFSKEYAMRKFFMMSDEDWDENEDLKKQIIAMEHMCNKYIKFGGFFASSGHVSKIPDDCSSRSI